MKAENEMTFFLSNPGSGTVDGTSTVEDALENIRAFVRDLTNMGLTKPRVRYRAPVRKPDDTGRVTFLLSRGDCEIDVSMPGRPTPEVRDQDGPLAHIPPRLYVDGSSWYWCFATDIVFDHLFDWNGDIKRASQRAQRRAQYEIRKRPRCLTCNAIRDLIDVSWSTYEPKDKTPINGRPPRNAHSRHPEVWIVRCRQCEPVVHEHKNSWGETLLVRQLPRGAFGTDEDPMCRKYVNRVPTGSLNSWHNYCRLPNKHEGPCEGDYTFTYKTRS